MTTEPRRTRPSRGAGVLVGSAVATLLLVAVLVAAAAVAAGTRGATGAAVGGLVVLGVCCLGLFSVHVVSHVLPAAALVFALFTYTLQVVVMTLALMAVTRSDLDMHEGWFVGGVIAAVGAWTVTQIVLSTRRRIPAYDVELPPGSTSHRPGAR